MLMMSLISALTQARHTPFNTEMAIIKSNKAKKKKEKKKSKAYLPTHQFKHALAFWVLKRTISLSLRWAGPHSAVSSVSDCRSRGHKFDPGQVPYFRGD